MKFSNLIVTFLLVVSFASVSFADGMSALHITDSFSFTALSGHRISYSIEADTLSIHLSDGTLLASDKPLISRSAFARDGYFQHGFKVYSTSGTEVLEYAMILRTKLRIPKNVGAAVNPTDFIDTRKLISANFWITDPVSKVEILTSRLFEGETELGKAISLRKSTCKNIFKE